jgi:hypothetical protein
MTPTVLGRSDGCKIIAGEHPVDHDANVPWPVGQDGGAPCQGHCCTIACSSPPRTLKTGFKEQLSRTINMSVGPITLQIRVQLIEIVGLC